MDRKAFEHPITVLVGLGFPATIESVLDAYALLDGWPVATRNPSHAIALKACRAALSGEIDPDTARAAFAKFAEKNHILIEEVTVPVLTKGISAAQRGALN